MIINENFEQVSETVAPVLQPMLTDKRNYKSSTCTVQQCPNALTTQTQSLGVPAALRTSRDKLWAIRSTCKTGGSDKIKIQFRNLKGWKKCLRQGTSKWTWEARLLALLMEQTSAKILSVIPKWHPSHCTYSQHLQTAVRAAQFSNI